MPVGWFVALRFMWEQRWQNLLIVSGVGVGVGVLVFISALIGGLQQSLIERTTGSQAHVVVTPLELEGRPVLREPPAGGTLLLRRIERPVQRMNTLPEWRKLDTNIAAVGGVAATAPIAAGPALAVRGPTERAVAVIGADPRRLDRIIAIDAKITQGSYTVNGSDVVLGVELAQDLGIGIGDRLRLETGRGGNQMFIVRGLVDMGNRAANEAWALMSLRNAQTLLDLGGAATALYVSVDDVYRADIVGRRIARLTGLTSKSWMETNAQLLTALRSQTASTTMIRFFVLITVGIGIASVLVVSVLQRSKEIGILRAMGVTRGGILRVFLLQGGLIGLLGSLAGCGLGAALSLLFQAALHNADGTPLFPFSLSPQLFAAAAGTALLAGLVAAAFPALRASRLDPAEAMRHG
jgi:lipoprotein-releasing system permease protein